LPYTDSPPSGKGRAVSMASVLPDKKEIMNEIQKRINEFYKEQERKEKRLERKKAKAK